MTTENRKRVALRVALGTAPPDSFVIFAKGENETSKGTFLFDALGAESVVAAYYDHGMDRLPIDYDHGMVGESGSPESGAAAGWFVPSVVNGALVATNVEWTPRAAEMIRNREFRFLSPAFFFDDDESRITELINVAITNLPATKNATPLVANQKPRPKTAENKGTKMSEKLFQILGAKDEAEAYMVATEFNKFTAELLNTTRSTSLDGALAAVKANAELPAKVQVLSAKIAEFEASECARDREALIAKLSTEGKLPPALHTWAREQSIESLSSFGESAPVHQTAKKNKDTGGSGVVLSAQDEKMIKLGLVSRDEFVAQRKLEKKGS